MLSDEFFKQYALTGPPKKEAAADPAAVKDTYTRAEVDEIVSKKIEEALQSMKQPEQESPENNPEDPGESEEE